jgi:hypothetical protein
MELDDIKQLLTANNEALVASIASGFNAEIAKLQSEISELKAAQKPAEETPKAEGEITTLALQTELQDLRSQLDQKERAALKSELFQTAYEALTSKKVKSPRFVAQSLVEQNLGKAKKEGTDLFITDGTSAKKFAVVIEDFLGTPEGKDLIAAEVTKGAEEKTLPGAKPLGVKADDKPKTAIDLLAAELAASK